MRKNFWRLIGVMVASVVIATLPTPANVISATPPKIRVPILMYHAVSNPPKDTPANWVENWLDPAMFRCQLKWLQKNKFTSISPDDLIDAILGKKQLPQNPILLTFDDGYADAWYSVVPTLKEFGFTGTFFVITSFVDSNNPGYLSWTQAKVMSDLGMSIDSHSVSHIRMDNKPADWLTSEAELSMEDIQKNVGIKPRAFCYPYGKYDGQTIRALRKAGYEAGFTTEDGFGSDYSRLMQLPRIRVNRSTTMNQFVWLVTRRVSELAPSAFACN